MIDAGLQALSDREGYNGCDFDVERDIVVKEIFCAMLESCLSKECRDLLNE
jgi:hypothetical protein